MSDPTREMLEDARLQLDMLREALGVSVDGCGNRNIIIHPIEEKPEGDQT